MPAQTDPGGGSSSPQSCFSWGGQLWGKDYPGWPTFRAWLLDHGADPDTWIANHPAAAQCIGATVSGGTGQPPPPPPPPPPTAQACFEWGGQQWGRDYPGWSDFRAWLVDHGADPNQWITDHPAAAQCIGAQALRFCFEWGGQRWGKDYPGWRKFAAWLTAHGSDPDEWIRQHTAAAQCIGAPAPTPTPSPTPPPYTTGLGPFAGRGVWTSDKPLSAERYGNGIEWVAIRPDQASADDVQALKDAGYRVVAWQDLATAAGVDFARAHCDGYIAQDEGPDQRAAALALEESIGGLPKALVTDNWSSSFPPGWVALPEAYTNDNPQATVAAVVNDAHTRGATAIAPVVGTYEGSDGTYAASRYLAEARAIGLTSLSAFSSEAMPEDDVPVWSTRAVSSAGPTTTGGGGTTLDASGKRFCFEWAGEKWGGDYAGWDAFRAWLTAHGANPVVWALQHVAAAQCIGAPGADGLGPDVTGGSAAGGQALADKVTLTHRDLENLWKLAGGPADTADVAAAIAQAESGGCRYAKHGPTDDRPVKACAYNHSTGENSYGLWQINRNAHPGFPAAELYTLAGNVAAALAVSNGGRDFHPWSTFTTPASHPPYLDYLEGTGIGGGVGGSSGGGGGSSGGGGGTGIGAGGGATGGTVTQPAGSNRAWKALLKVFSRTVPAKRDAALAALANPKEWIK